MLYGLFTCRWPGLGDKRDGQVCASVGSVKHIFNNFNWKHLRPKLIIYNYTCLASLCIHYLCTSFFNYIKTLSKLNYILEYILCMTPICYFHVSRDFQFYRSIFCTDGLKERYSQVGDKLNRLIDNKTYRYRNTGDLF